MNIIRGASYCGRTDAAVKLQKVSPRYKSFETGFRYVIPVVDGELQRTQ
jgi:hypothetical protein